MVRPTGRRQVAGAAGTRVGFTPGIEVGALRTLACASTSCAMRRVYHVAAGVARRRDAGGSAPRDDLMMLDQLSVRLPGRGREGRQPDEVRGRLGRSLR